MIHSWLALLYALFLAFVVLAAITDFGVEPDPAEKPIDPAFIRFLDHLTSASLTAGVFAIALGLDTPAVAAVWRFVAVPFTIFFLVQATREVRWRWTSPHSTSSRFAVVIGALVSSLLFLPAVALNFRLAFVP